MNILEKLEKTFDEAIEKGDIDSIKSLHENGQLDLISDHITEILTNMWEEIIFDIRDKGTDKILEMLGDIYFLLDQEEDYEEAKHYLNINQLYQSIEDGNVDKFKELLEKRSNYTDEIFESGDIYEDMIDYSISYNRLNILSLLIKNIDNKEEMDKYLTRIERS